MSLKIEFLGVEISEKTGEPVAEFREPAFLCEIQQECGGGDEAGLYFRTAAELQGDLEEMVPKMHIEKPDVQANVELMQEVLLTMDMMAGSN